MEGGGMGSHWWVMAGECFQVPAPCPMHVSLLLLSKTINQNPGTSVQGGSVFHPHGWVVVKTQTSPIPPSSTQSGTGSRRGQCW